jgi:hypothetical protein
LNVFNDSISCLRDENVRLNAKIEELNAYKPSTSTVEHVSICTRCRDVNVEAMNDHLAMIKQQNDHIAKLSAKIASSIPNHHNLWHPSFLEITFNTRASSFTPRHISKDQTLSKPRIQLKHLVTCERVCSCSFALLFLGLPFFFLILVLK